MIHINVNTVQLEASTALYKASRRFEIDATVLVARFNHDNELRKIRKSKRG